MKALITGGNGFVGAYLSKILIQDGWETFTFDMCAPKEGQVASGKCMIGDICSPDAVKDALKTSDPDVIFHLAGVSYVPAAEKDKDTALRVNLKGGINLFEQTLAFAPQAKVLVASSSEVYGRVKEEEIPLKENTPIRPNTFYAFTKAALETAAFYAKSLGVNTTVLRPFNHIGPEQNSQFVTAAFARQVAEAEKKLRPPVIHVGNLEAVRDFTDVEDMTRAYQEAGKADLNHPVYNLGSGMGTRIQEILDILLGLGEIKIRVEEDPARLRPSDTPKLIGDASRFMQETGWAPKIPLKESLIRILDYWRKRL